MEAISGTCRDSSLRMLILSCACLFWLGEAAAMTFEDVSVDAGFTPAHDTNYPSGGIAVADFDGNGWPDIFVTAHFGLGNHTAVDVTVHWPNGHVQSLGSMPAGQYHTIGYPVIFRDQFD